MSQSSVVERANRALLVVSALVIFTITAIGLREAVSAVPRCPGGLSDCPVRQAHVTGSLTVAAMIAAVWGYLALWFAITRRVARRRLGASMLPLFWLLPVLLVGLAIMLIG